MEIPPTHTHKIIVDCDDNKERMVNGGKKSYSAKPYNCLQ